jgi:hypothetical protein
MINGIGEGSDSGYPLFCFVRMDWILLMDKLLPFSHEYALRDRASRSFLYKNLLMRFRVWQKTHEEQVIPGEDL